MNNGEKPGRLSRYNTRRSSIGEGHKPYEHMLLKELPGIKRSNAAMHAVLESVLEDNIYESIHEAQKVRNQALIHYLASLANSNSNDDIFDFDFVESLIDNGADVNSTDRNGQTIFHEVARSWNLDVALFLLEHGADLNQQDKFGRSPLHVAAAVDYADMVRFLVKNGADINIQTYGEEQMPIHYAAKNDACKSLKMLLGYGANIDSRDMKNRTPLQVAAEMNRAKSAKLLVQHGAPAGVHDNTGNSALTLLIEKLPHVAIAALDQFHSISTINRKEFFFLNYLEGNRLQDPKSPAYSALEIAVQNQEFDIVLHPVMKRLIDVKWQKFGRQGAVSSLCLNMLYAILWTILAVTSPLQGDELYLPWSRKAWRLVISGIVCLMTIDEIRRQVTGTLRTRNRQKKWIAWRASELEEDLQFCHPRWPQEEIYLKSEIKAIRDTPLISTGDSWIYFDWFSLILILGTIASHLVFFNLNSEISQILYARIITVLLLVLWLRIMQYARPFEGAGPFVAIFAHILKDIINWGILTLLITVPYACAFWITFGEQSRNPVPRFSRVSSLVYELFSMIVVNDHDFEALEMADSTMARILCGSYIAIMAIINLNILIALLSDTFTRVYGNAVANAVMQRAKTILFLEKSLTRKGRREYEEFIKNYGSPETVELVRDLSASTDRDEQKTANMLKESVKEIHYLIHDRFGKSYGEGKKSDLDHIRESLEKICEGRERCGCKGIKRKIDFIEEVLVKLSKTLKVDISGMGNNEEYCSGEETFVRQPQLEGQGTKRSPSEWSHDDSSHITPYNVQRLGQEQQFWSANKAAVNEGYQFEDAETGIGQKTRDSIRRRLPKKITCKPGRRSTGIELDYIDKRRSTNIGQSSQDGEFAITADSAFIPYKRERDDTESHRSRGGRMKVPSDIYQQRSRGEDESTFPTVSREPYFLRQVPNDDVTSVRSVGVHIYQRPSETIRSHALLRRTESSPSRTRKNVYPSRRPRESGYPRTGTSPTTSLNPDSRHGQVRKRGQNRNESVLERKRTPDRRPSLISGRNSVVLKREGTSSINIVYPDDTADELPEKNDNMMKRRAQEKTRSKAGSDTSASDSSQEEISSDDHTNNAHSDNDVIQKRASRFRHKRFLEDWDNRSVKSVAF